jgi:hypothetical protein
LNLSRLAFLLVLAPLPSCAQAPAQQATYTPPPPQSWEALGNVPEGTKVHVTADHSHRTCKVVSVEKTQFVCIGGTFSDVTYTFPRPEIRHIKLVRHERSAWTGVLIGGVSGAMAGDLISRAHDDAYADLSGAAGFIVFGGIGAVVGATTDFTRGPVVYSR